jgi:hypothetical protein
MCRGHNGSIGILNGDGVLGKAFVDNRAVEREIMRRTSTVGDDVVVVYGGRTYCSSCTCRERRSV